MIVYNRLCCENDEAFRESKVMNMGQRKVKIVGDARRRRQDGGS